ncbi:MAG: hypothetical protein HOV96_15060 [Nonomuraea sp.]|nr:hypothetical protein [Nonomuraea sp.]NUP67016.1 hypothetical protein [Nonomuraea sp.]NUP78856.1 hypothetical protein [Nonomuraea sp.]NUS09502.1 hypothetical protein [Nonomuraea sp.]NUT10615.1 hypothetical protein [Nonomuraea sp.]
MAGLDIHFDALDDCRTAAKTVAGKFGDLADGYPAKAADSSIFGKLAGSSALATAVDLVESTADREFGKAKSLVQSVERALDLVESNVRKANSPS